jgi:hypothetical protein
MSHLEIHFSFILKQCLNKNRSTPRRTCVGTMERGREGERSEFEIVNI